MEDIQVVKRGPGRQHQPVLADVQNQRAGRRLRQREGEGEGESESERGVLEQDPNSKKHQHLNSTSDNGRKI